MKKDTHMHTHIKRFEMLPRGVSVCDRKEAASCNGACKKLEKFFLLTPMTA